METVTAERSDWSRPRRSGAVAANAPHPTVRGEVRRAVQRRQNSVVSCISISARRRSPSGPCRPWKQDDAIVATYREHGHALARAFRWTASWRKCMASQAGCSRGTRRFHAPVSTQHDFLWGQCDRRRWIAFAVGLGAGRQLAAATASSRPASLAMVRWPKGSFTRSLNLAALWRLPVLFCARTTSTQWARALQRHRIAARYPPEGPSYRMEARQGRRHGCSRGREAARPAVLAIRAVQAESRTFSKLEHIVSAPIRCTILICIEINREIEPWKQRDPITMFRGWLELRPHGPVG